jgi:hypothetical protein
VLVQAVAAELAALGKAEQITHSTSEERGTVVLV